MLRDKRLPLSWLFSHTFTSSTAVFIALSQQDPLCTGLHLFLVSLRRHLPLHDDDGTTSFRGTLARLLEQRNFLAQHGSELGHTWSVSIALNVIGRVARSLTRPWFGSGRIGSENLEGCTGRVWSGRVQKV